MLKIYLWKELLSTEKLIILVQVFLFIPHENIKMLSGGHRKATVYNGLSKTIIERRKVYIREILLFSCLFLIIHKRVKCVSLTPYNHHYQCKSCLINAQIDVVCLNSSKMFMIVTLPS